MYVPIILCALVHFAIGFQDRIIGGNDAFIAKHPYQAALYRRTPFHEGLFCSAVILNSSFLLTTGYCAFGKPEIYSVVVGESFIPKHYDAEWLNKRAYKIKNIIRHPDHDLWGTSEMSNNIAVLEIDGTLRVDGKFVEPIEIAEKPVTTGTIAVVSGFGDKEFPPSGDRDRDVFVHLAAAFVPVLDHTSCQKYIREEKFPGYNLRADQICAGLEKDVGSCLNDHGAPLVVDDTLIGLVTYINNCLGGVGTYIDVQKHRDFIQSATTGRIQSINI